MVHSLIGVSGGFRAPGYRRQETSPLLQLLTEAAIWKQLRRGQTARCWRNSPGLDSGGFVFCWVTDCTEFGKSVQICSSFAWNQLQDQRTLKSRFTCTPSAFINVLILYAQWSLHILVVSVWREICLKNVTNVYDMIHIFNEFLSWLNEIKKTNSNNLYEQKDHSRGSHIKHLHEPHLFKTRLFYFC